MTQVTDVPPHVSSDPQMDELQSSRVVERRIFRPWVVFIFGAVGGAAATLGWQAMREPTHETLSRVTSPAGTWECVVERYDPGLMFGGGPPWRTFKMCLAGDLRDSPEPRDGSIYQLHEYASGGIDMSNMTVRWSGSRALVSFNGFPTLEWDVLRDTEWHMLPPPPPATTRAAGG